VELQHRAGPGGSRAALPEDSPRPVRGKLQHLPEPGPSGPPGMDVDVVSRLVDCHCHALALRPPFPRRSLRSPRRGLELSRTWSARWTAQERMGSRPAAAGGGARACPSAPTSRTRNPLKSAGAVGGGSWTWLKLGSLVGPRFALATLLRRSPNPQMSALAAGGGSWTLPTLGSSRGGPCLGEAT